MSFWTPWARFFVECEVRTSADAYTSVRAQIGGWLRDVLGLALAAEAPSMLDLLIQHRE